jgi:hypothetical protein
MAEYRKPTFECFKRADHPDLAESLDELHRTLGVVARQIGYELNFTREQFQTHGMPEAMAALLDRMDDGPAIVAAQTYLETRGFTITKGVPDGQEKETADAARRPAR